MRAVLGSRSTPRESRPLSKGPKTLPGAGHGVSQGGARGYPRARPAPGAAGDTAHSARGRWPCSTLCLKALGDAPFPLGPPHPTPDSGPLLGPLGADRKPVEQTALLYLEILELCWLSPAGTLCL